MKNNKKLTIAVAGLLAAILLVAGIAAAVRTTTSSKVLVVPVSDLNYGQMIDWENSVSGMVTGDATQSIYLSDTETVESVMVTEGQAVHKGDVLLKYDTKATKLNLEKEKINREKILLDLEVARKNLETLENTSPTSDGGDFGFDGDFDDFEDTEIYENAEVYVKKLTADAKPINGDSEDSEAEFMPGTEEDPYIFLVDGDSIIITRDFIRKWQKIAKKNKMKQLYFAIEKRDKNYNLIKAWETDVMLLDPAYDIEVDLSTGKTIYSGIKDPADMAKLIRKVLKEVPEDERGLWLAVLLDKLAITTEKEDKLKERGELLASAINELNTEDREELAAVAAKLDELTLATLLSSLTSEQISKVDAVVIADLFTKMLESMSEKQIRNLDPDILGSFLNSLTTDQLRALSPEKVAAIVSAFDDEELEEVLDGLPQSKKDTIQRIVEKWKAQLEKEETQNNENNTGNPSDSVEENNPDETESNNNKGNSQQESENGGDGSEEQGSPESSDPAQEKPEGEEPEDNGGQEAVTEEPDDGGSDEDAGNSEDTQSTENTENSENTESTGTEETPAPANDSAPAAENASSASSNPSTAPEPEDEDVEDISGDTKGGKNGSGLLSPDLEYTSKELEEAKREQQDNIKSLELDLRESDIKIRQAERALEKGTVTANMNGVVKYVGDPAAPPTDGSAFLTVAGEDGLYIKSGIKESLYGTLQVGDMVTVVSWQSGGRYEAEIKSISPYPESGEMYGGEGETYYPFTAGVSDENAQLENGEYVEVTYKASSAIGSSGGALTIMKPFVREEGSKKYVFMRDENKKLKKQYIKTGTLSDAGYEVIAGITESDWVAFPYGKNVKEGAKTYEGSPEELYN